MRACVCACVLAVWNKILATENLESRTQTLDDSSESKTATFHLEPRVMSVISAGYDVNQPFMNKRNLPFKIGTCNQLLNDQNLLLFRLMFVYYDDSRRRSRNHQMSISSSREDYFYHVMTV